MRTKYILVLGAVLLISFISACYCGDGIVNQNGEECDLGSLNGVECVAGYGKTCDFCSIDCLWEEIVGPYCGDEEIQNSPEEGTVYYVEECDYGTLNGILCEAGYETFCEYCRQDCTIEQIFGGFCGDSILQDQEECDDGNNVNGDGCGKNCEVETGGCPENDYDCDGIIDEEDNCVFVWNPNQLDTDHDGRGDVCDFIPYGYCGDWVCNGAENCATCPHDCDPCGDGPVCGNRILENGEECDDGNNINGDGCSQMCTIEGDYTPYCGDSILTTGEECDDGNNVNGDGCSMFCTLEGTNHEDNDTDQNETINLCGNGRIDGDEECDDGTENGKRCDNDNRDCEYCSTSCKIIERKEAKSSGSSDNDGGRIIPYTRFCDPNWDCGPWSACLNGAMIRECIDTNKCNLNINKPIEMVACELSSVKIEVGKDSNFPWWIALIIALGVIGVAVWIVNR